MTINKPAIEEVPIAKLFTDHQVQRDLDQRRAEKNSAEQVFVREAVGVPRVSAREDGTMHLIDGQHRKAMLELAGYGDDTVTCQVFHGLTVAEEATLFRLANNAKAVSPIDRFRIRVQEGERNAVVLNTILDRYGWRVRTVPDRGCFAAVRAFEGVLNGRAKDGISTPLVCDTLIRVITEAWGNDPAAVRGELISALGGVLLRHFEHVDDKHLVKQMRAYQGGPLELLRVAKGMQQFRGGRLADSVAETIIDMIYNKGKHKRNQLPAWRDYSPSTVS